MPSPDHQQPMASQSKISRIDNNSVAVPKTDAVNLHQIYALIDSILPFEACLYYQVLPLFIEGSRLIIGTVNPDDPGASEYVKKQLSYINYTLSFKEISSDCHRDLLSKYLNHMSKKQQQIVEPVTLPNESPESPSLNSVFNDRNVQKTLVVDQPTEITEINYRHQSLDQKIDFTLELDLPTLTPETEGRLEDATNFSDQHAINQTHPEVVAPACPKPPAVATNDPLSLKLDTRYRDVANSRLLSLAPNALMQALLSKVLDEGIGRLYFERLTQGGRILWSRDGVLQSIVEAIDGQIFQGVINELKRLTHVSLISVKKAKQVEIERSYQGQRILLRFRVMPSTDGEEATLQVLRGAALRFYQQQQIDRLGRDALDAAQVLQNHLNEIRIRAGHSLNSPTTRSETLPTLVKLLKHMETQVEEILTTYDLIEVEAALATSHSHK